ncbi:MAG: hypothetical protein ACQXXF_03100, partial [Thermoplasmatota archaeon]
QLRLDLVLLLLHLVTYLLMQYLE